MNGKPFVILLGTSYDPQRIVASAAKLCYSSSDISSLVEAQTEEKTASFIEMLATIGHESPIEHASFTFGIENVSRALLAQITRHRIASFSVQSQRYVKMKELDYITPPRISKNAEALKIYQQQMESVKETYDSLIDLLIEDEVTGILEQNPSMDEETARKKAEKNVQEDARFILPNAAATKMVVTMNARSLMNFFKHRCCNRAQWEIRDLATQMLKLCREAAPQIFKNAGPPCLNSSCPEGKMSCGKITEVREEFNNI